MVIEDVESCYRAVVSRDPRFDGRFFTGVKTTGIYCRPICPAKPPRRENVRFFAAAAAAEEAGFRPCRRCRPETAPGTPAWLGTSATVARALRLIADGALDGHGLDDLARRVGVGGRQLRRLFAQHLGASPLAVARTRRVHFARQLIDETDLPMTQVALGVGFSSLRQFNHAIRATFGRAPTELRRSAAPAGALTLHLPYRPPLDWPALVAFLAPRTIPGVEAVENGAYKRTIVLDGGWGTMEVRPAAGAPALELRLALRARGPANLIQIVERVRRLFDLAADPLDIAADLGLDPRLAPALARHPGLRVPGAWDPFELAVRAILGQQVTVAGATTLAGRLVAAFGRPIDGEAPPGLTHLFPPPAALAAADLERIGLPRARAAAIRALAAAVGAGNGLTHLTDIPGIGAWTAEYVAMRALGEPDAFPAGDLGLRRALAAGDGPLAAAALTREAEAWRPWRAYAAMHLWMMAMEEDSNANHASRERHHALAHRPHRALRP